MKARRQFKIALFVAGGAISVLGLVRAYTIWSYATGFGELTEAVWQPENRLMLAEYVAPDSLSKIGVYQCDAGAFGYTVLNVSMVEIGEDYPIQANLFKSDKVPASVFWSDGKDVLIRVYSDYGVSQAITGPPLDENKDRVRIRYELVERNQ